MISKLVNYGSAVIAIAWFAWVTRRIIRNRTDVSRMRGEVTAEQSPLSDWEEERWEQIKAALGGSPAARRKGRLP